MVAGKMEVMGGAKERGVAFFPIVDVLRALSVLAVVAYHAGIPGISGGYVGVDVFFVISGFLIIRQIVNEHQRGNFSWSGFWARRVLRILPTYLLVIVVSSLIALYVLVMPEEFREFGRQVAWSAGMVVNHLFLGEQGYFDTSAESKPLLHLWSLAVEEQFYLFAPIILSVLCWLGSSRFGQAGRRVVAALVAVMFIASLWLCIRYTAQDEGAKNYAFFMMPLRAWEFMLGGLVPLMVPYLRRLPSAIMPLLALAGFGLILGAIFGFSHDTLFPYWNAAFPAVGATLVIAAGLAAPDMRLTRLLAVKPVLWVGLLSYAWYLWHWPLMAFSRIYNFGVLPLKWGIGMALLSLVLAALSYRLIEEPIKNWRQRARPKLDLRYIVPGVLACLIVVGAGQLMAKKLPEIVKANIPKSMAPGRGQNSKHCHLVDMKSVARCQAALKSEGHARQGLLVGDSHARAAFKEVQRFGEERHDASTLTMIAMNCTPIQQVRLYYSQQSKKVFPCHQRKHAALSLIEKGVFSPEYAIIYSRWNATTPWQVPMMDDGRQRRALGYMNEREAHSNQEEIFVQKMAELIRSLQESGVRKVLVIAPTPEFNSNVSSCLLRADKYGLRRDEHCSVPLSRVLGRREFSRPWLEKAVLGLRDVRLIDPMPVFCDGSYCRGYEGDKVLYRDDDHINDAGMRRIIGRYRGDFDWVMRVD